MLSGQALVTRVARDSGIEQHAVAGLQPFHIITDRFHHACTVTTQYVGKVEGQPREPFQREEVQVVQRPCLQGYAHITGSRDFRNRHVGHLEHRQIAVPAQHQSPHEMVVRYRLKAGKKNCCRGGTGGTSTGIPAAAPVSGMINNFRMGLRFTCSCTVKATVFPSAEIV